MSDFNFLSFSSYTLLRFKETNLFVEIAVIGAKKKVRIEMPISRRLKVFGVMSTKQVTVNVCAITAQIKMIRTYFAP